MIGVDSNKQAKPSDLHLGYSGASGGFILLHLLLCSGDYFVDFNSSFSFDDIIENQWKITDPADWKLKEVWPDLWRTIWSDSDLSKIYFFCSPSTTEYFELAQEYILQAYSNIKDQSWPDIDGFECYQHLPTHIRDECEQVHGLAPLIQYYSRHKKFVWIYTDTLTQNELGFYKKAGWYYQEPNTPKKDLPQSLTYNNHQVYANIMPFLLRCGIVLRLQDVIADPTILIDLGLVGSINDKQKKLIGHWLSLHPPDLMQEMGFLAAKPSINIRKEPKQ